MPRQKTSTHNNTQPQKPIPFKLQAHDPDTKSEPATRNNERGWLSQPSLKAVLLSIVSMINDKSTG
eukprot:scaffold17624_cov77-Cyclotella_meneghiniana.AAC.7